MKTHRVASRVKFQLENGQTVYSSGAVLTPLGLKDRMTNKKSRDHQRFNTLLISLKILQQLKANIMTSGH